MLVIACGYIVGMAVVGVVVVGAVSGNWGWLQLLVQIGATWIPGTVVGP